MELRPGDCTGFVRPIVGVQAPERLLPLGHVLHAWNIAPALWSDHHSHRSDGMRAPTTPANYAQVRLPVPDGDIAREAAAGLAGLPRSLPCKLFYDAAGCALFAAICETPEYYLRRSEAAIFASRMEAIAGRIGPVNAVIEPGAGNCNKAATLLAALTAQHFVALDIAPEVLAPGASAIARQHPELTVRAIVMDFVRDIEAAGPWLPEHGRRLVFYPGSSIGNFLPGECVALLARFAQLAGREGGLLIGFDAKKEARRLHAAYNDAAGLTARFNRNLLARLNRECDAGFDLEAFEHYAMYRPDLGRIEMHLVCHRTQTVRLDGQEFEIRDGEALHTENAYKYLVEEFDALAHAAGWSAQDGWCDPAGDFWLRYYTTSPSGERAS